MPYRNGKAVNWEVKVRGIKELLTDDNSNENAIKVGEKIYDILTSQRYAKYFEEFDYLNDFICIDYVYQLNGVLSLLYDYADENLIWIE